MQVIQYTDKDGRQFYNAEFCGPLIGETVRRLGYDCKIVMLEMTEAEYFAFPATNESAELWRVDPLAAAPAGGETGEL